MVTSVRERLRKEQERVEISVPRAPNLSHHVTLAGAELVEDALWQNEPVVLPSKSKSYLLKREIHHFMGRAAGATSNGVPITSRRSAECNCQCYHHLRGNSGRRSRNANESHRSCLTFVSTCLSFRWPTLLIWITHRCSGFQSSPLSLYKLRPSLLLFKPALLRTLHRLQLSCMDCAA